MKRSVWVVIGVLACSGVVAAATVDEFKEAVNKEGCESIPYSSLRSTCTSKSTEVTNWCKNSSKPISCDGLDPAGLTQQIENVKQKIAALKRERDDLASKIAGAADDSERRDLEEKKKAKENEIYELEKKVAEWERKLADEKTSIGDRIYNGERCVGFREELARVFVDAKSSAKSESDPAIKPYAEKLVAKWEAGERTHADTIADYKRALEKCRRMK